jgi:DtxR family Mn-dependent transcriptional regulator
MEALYKAGEENDLPISIDLLNLPSRPTEMEIRQLLQRDLIVINDGKIDLTVKGRNTAELIVRRHRLAERLFSEILDLKDQALESTSCSFEHVLDPAVTESVCSMLGHPPTCPHGKRIPPGPCCKSAQRQIAPVVLPLSELSPGQNAKIVFITTPHHKRFDRLVNLGVIPGGKIKLIQKIPSYLLKVGSTEVAIDDEIASEIFVRRIIGEVRAI